ncbi:MAG: non-canonical purine NTP pyrophosphatase, partial [Candidatus Nanopelagicales bacterium]
MTDRVILATRNAHKVDEVRRILAAHGLDIEIVPLPDDAPDVPETESTFAGNALLKARAIAEITGMPAIADDSGLCVDAL